MDYLVTLAIIAMPLVSGMIAMRFYTEKEKPYVFFCSAAIASVFGAFCVIGHDPKSFNTIPWMGWTAMVGFGLAAIVIPIVMQLQRMETIMENLVEDLLVMNEEDEEDPQPKRKTHIWGREA